MESFERRETMSISVGDFYKEGIESVLVRVHSFGITAALRCRPTLSNRRGMERRRQCYDLNICSTLIRRGRHDGKV